MRQRSRSRAPGRWDSRRPSWRWPPEADQGGAGNGYPRQWHPGSGHSHFRGFLWRVSQRPGPLRRKLDERLAGGVAAGLADRLGLDVTVIRVAFIIAGLIGGFGLTAYVLAWLLIPAAGRDSNIASRALADRRGIALAAAVASLLAVLLTLASLAGTAWIGPPAWPMVVGVAGLILIWRNAPPDEQRVLRKLADPVLGLAEPGTRSWLWLRLVAACLLIAGGVGLLAIGHPGRQVTLTFGGVLLLLTAIVLGLGPWWLRVGRDLVAERQARARAEERADLAARLHDSVLQTLALIQRRADDPRQVIRLARVQERELRSWLFEGQIPGSAAAGETVAAGVRQIQQDVEAQHEVAIDAVTVGDCPVDDDLAALLAAAREATVNSAKWSGSAMISVFAEVEPASVAIYVRDRGRGFDPAAIPPDRRGVSESIYGRMERHGGSAKVRSAPGEGTEVALIMPRRSAEAGRS